MINFGPIEANLFVGSAPQSAIDITRLTQLKVTAVLSLQSDQDLTAYRIKWPELQHEYDSNNIVVQRFPIIDFDERDLGNKLAQPINALNNLLGVGHRVYVHCNAGICRAPATVLGYLCVYRDMSIEQGLEYIRTNRPQANPYISAVNKAVEEIAGQA